MTRRLFLLLLFLAVTAELSLTRLSAVSVGVNWGTEASHPLPPSKVVELLKSNGIAKVKLFDADPKVLQALSGSNIGVTVGIPNSMIKSLNASRKVAESWVHDNVTRYFDGGNRVRIEYVAVGDEPFLQSYGNQYRPFVIGAAMNIQNALAKASLASEVKVVVPSSFDSFLSESGRPSSGHFRADLNKTMIELLSFLTRHHSPSFLFKETAKAHKDGRKTYRNSFDLSYNTLVSALSSIGFPDVDIVVSKIGWPTDVAANATTPTAEAFLKGLMGHLEKKTGSLPRPPVETYIENLLDEDKRNVSSGNFERHWGVFTFDGQAKYSFSFNHNSKQLINAQNVQYLPPKWCVVNNNKDLSNASAKALEAIGWPRNVSYAFNSLYQQSDHKAESCDFGGLGLITTVDPSEDKCRFWIQLDTSHSYSHVPVFFLSWSLLLLFLLS
ncbi:hypothetical protein Bca52824_036182 [Brassica carinata]|uniref:glucan endo-1,3-beta-D-glucosidase n=1 Tax=Brassica carinata TaxID=52824 RepID=A0A8X7S6N4_BRACI|nr:hypothetical protein Bca52824_036182 [Brassica carinata]